MYIYKVPTFNRQQRHSYLLKHKNYFTQEYLDSLFFRAVCKHIKAFKEPILYNSMDLSVYGELIDMGFEQKNRLEKGEKISGTFNINIEVYSDADDISRLKYVNCRPVNIISITIRNQNNSATFKWEEI